jgi:hypothetical protein
MRIWHVPFHELDDQRVLGQHREIHMLWNLVVRLDRPWGGLTQADEPYIVSVHDSSVEEMVLRGWTGHGTPMIPTVPMSECNTQTTTRLTLGALKPMRERRRTDRWHLVCRWDGQYRGRVQSVGAEGMRDYQEHRVQYAAQGGCLHDGEWEQHTVTGTVVTELCLLCKRHTRERTKPLVRRGIR